MENYFNNKGLLDIILKWKKHLFIIIIFAVVVSTIVAFIIPPKYKSTAILYPANLTTMSEESPTEQMLQILDSKEIRDSIFTKFNLAKHYDIDVNDKYYRSKLYKKFNNHVDIKKTEYESVEISVLDTDRDTAYLIVMALIDYYNKKVRTIHREKYMETVIVKKNEMEKHKKEIDSLEVRLHEIRTKYGLLDFTYQTKELTRGYTELIAAGKADSKYSTEIVNMLKNLGDKSDEFFSLNSYYWNEIGVYNNIKNEYNAALRDAEKEITFSHIVTHPFPADKKSYPIRWLIVVGSTLSVLILAIISVAIIESRKKQIQTT